MNGNHHDQDEDMSAPSLTQSPLSLQYITIAESNGKDNNENNANENNSFAINSNSNNDNRSNIASSGAPDTPPPESLPEEKKTQKKIIRDSDDEVTLSPLLHPHKKKKRISEVFAKYLDPPDAQHDGWPYELVLVRHGQSEGNEAQSRSKKGDLSAYTPEFKKKHSSAYRLTDKGIAQAVRAGEWIRENIGDRFDRYYTSEYVRAMETAALLELPGATWYTEIVLRERDKGTLDNISYTEKNERFGDELARRKRDSFFWAPPGGESIANVCVRVDHTFNTLRRECKNQKVIIVCHGEVMWAFRVRLERLSQIRYQQLQSSKDPKDAIHNTTVLHYTRIHPVTGEIYPYFKFMRSECPWHPEYSTGWMEFERPTYSNEELMQSVKTVPRFVNNLVPFDQPNRPTTPISESTVS
eukprot:TRINITY_DN7777_c0_g1_i1.p1 TRINITY_DN7777_c0_g1~~TRINITY_DN7777_c0_g1_i1.p1  ORF type:complete len:412 (-),score=78.75 TRINITY_DN7777_c0_g1_i1:372-1607(-)